MIPAAVQYGGGTGPVPEGSGGCARLVGELSIVDLALRQGRLPALSANDQAALYANMAWSLGSGRPRESPPRL